MRGVSMKCVKISPTELRGQISIPPSKSVSHRMLICASLAHGKSIISNVALSDDIMATLSGIKALGATVNYVKDCSSKTYDVTVEGCGFPQIVESTIDCRESGSTIRFLIPVALLAGQEITFTGRGRLSQRPLDIYCRIFKNQGINYYPNTGGLPITFSGKLKPGVFYVEGNVSSQFISGLLFALPLLDEDSEIIVTTPVESKGYIDLTIDVLKKFSILVDNHGYEYFKVKGNQSYQPTSCRVEGDYSQCAFWLVAGIINGEIICRDLDPNSLQGDKSIIDILIKMGADVVVGNNFVHVRSSKTSGIIIDASQCPDLVPPLAVLGALSQGTTRIINAGRLKIKESDRLKAISCELAKLGAKIKELPEGLEIYGQDMLKGGTVDSWNDHRIAMAMAIAALRCKNPVIIKNSNSVNKSYPHFWDDFKRLGGIIDELDLRI